MTDEEMKKYKQEVKSLADEVIVALENNEHIQATDKLTRLFQLTGGALALRQTPPGKPIDFLTSDQMVFLGNVHELAEEALNLCNEGRDDIALSQIKELVGRLNH